ncbi:hypothetical protein DINM_004328 [Dirofilaria immitis]|nr:hypothetical protein [Dirofilaria immitis]
MKWDIDQIPRKATDVMILSDTQRNKTTRCSGMVLFQDLDMIASIVAKEQALLKMNTAAAASSTAEHNRLTGFAIPNRAHTQVIVNGARENMSSPSEMSPNSCSPSSSDTLQSTQGVPVLQFMHITNIPAQKTLHQKWKCVSHLNENLNNDVMPLCPSVSASMDKHTVCCSFNLAYQQHSLGPSNSSQQQQTSSSREGNVQAGTTTLRSRHRSSHHDGLIKCHYCPKKWADQAVIKKSESEVAQYASSLGLWDEFIEVVGRLEEYVKHICYVFADSQIKSRITKSGISVGHSSHNSVL